MKRSDMIKKVILLLLLLLSRTPWFEAGLGWVSVSLVLGLGGKGEVSFGPPLAYVQYSRAAGLCPLLWMFLFSCPGGAGQVHKL